jgi:hypothetical protein
VAIERLTIDDFSDREFLLVLADVADPDGWALASDIADQLDLAHKAIASSRLSWLRRWGAVEREHERDEHGVLRYTADGKPRHTQRWKLTPEGHAVAFGALKKGQESTLAKIGDDQLLAVTRWLSERTRADGAVSARLSQREWRYGHAKGRG